MVEPEIARESPILFVNADETVALIDIPTAIACAQVPNGFINDKALYSTPPRTEPYPPNEPKTDRARQNLATLNCDATGLERVYREIIRHGLDEIRQHWRGSWCLWRKILPGHNPNATLKKTPARKTLVAGVQALALESRESSLEAEDVNMKPAEPDLRRNEPLADFLSSLVGEVRVQTGKFSYYAKHPSGVLPESYLPPQSYPEAWDSGFANPSNTTLNLTITDHESERSLTFVVPPHSTCLVAKVESSPTFRSLVRSSFQPVPGFNATKVFNFICLDPPWPNTSVARKHNYNNMRYLNDLVRALHSMDLDQYILPGGYVGVWITNKPAMRKAVLEPGGLFDTWNVQLQEEWIYSKTTVHGEPMTTLDGLWRKPYEIFLLGKAPENPICKVPPVFESTWNGVALVNRRVIVAVPDFHSRKPCLKSLVERWLGFEEGKYEALEVFARYAISGWWSWGDECLRFNWDGYWADREDKMEV